MTVNEKLDECQRIATTLHGVGIGFQYREENSAEHHMTLYRSTGRRGNINLRREVGTSYEDVVDRLLQFLKGEERAAEEGKKMAVAITTVENGKVRRVLDVAVFLRKPGEVLLGELRARMAEANVTEAHWFQHLTVGDLDKLDAELLTVFQSWLQQSGSASFSNLPVPSNGATP